jgi:hypothetical protein
MTPVRFRLNTLCQVVIVIVVALGLRIANFPARFEFRNIDETGYCAGSLQLLEGISPGYKAAPAGPLFWTGWLWTGGQTLWDLLHPTPDERHASFAVRPFLALNRVLFDNYRDLSHLHRVLVVANLIIALLGAAAAARLGSLYGGAVGALLVGGMFAVVPVFLQLSEMSRPYSMAWSFGVMAFYFACGPVSALRLIIAGLCLGLSIASRIEMLCLLPLVWWILWDQSTAGKRLGRCLKVTVLSICVATWVSPWLMTHLIGNLRTIATVRLGGSPGGSAGWLTALKVLAIDNGMGVAMVLALVALFLQPKAVRLRRLVLAIYALMLLISMLGELAYGAHQHGEVFLAWFLLLGVVIRPAVDRFPITTVCAAVIAVLFPLVLSVLSIRTDRANRTDEDAVGWIEKHVPAGTSVYVLDGGMRTLLPTQASADALWNEVNDQQAWRKKMESGLRRFDLSVDQFPRALSEENLVQERGNRRKWFILGSQTKSPIPRYDIHVVLSSPVFGIRDLDAALKEKGGVVLWRDGFDLPVPKLGILIRQWTSPSGDSVKIYCTPDAKWNIRADSSN